MPEIQYYNKDWEVSDALQAFYTPYASYVIQTRALPDARDGLKTGARFILYAQYKDKLTYKNKRRKAVATVNAAMRFSPHGDSSILGTAVRLSQDFSLRYPIIEVQGNNGSFLAGDDYSQARYLEMRGNEIAYEMTHLLEKETIEKWKLNYTEEELYPTVLPSKFPYALVNGNFGIGVACASSVPPHNIKDVCAAAITLINNPEATFEELYCPIDFPTGGTIVNEEEVKDSLKKGTGKAALVRASIDYDEKNHELIVYEMPYMTFTGSTVATISQLVNEKVLSGIESIIDGTDFDGVKIYIKLEKGANPSRVIKSLYKNTPLQNDYSINMNMLKDGVTPKLFTWKEQLETYVSFLRDIIVKAFSYDLNKLLSRIHILDGFIIAFANLNEIIEIIKKSKDHSEAKNELTSIYNLDNDQAEAILNMKLSRLTSIEIEKIVQEKNEKQNEAERIQNILNSEELIKKEMINDIESICEKYGDERRTKNINLDFVKEKEEDIEPIEKKELLIYFTNMNNFYTQETTTLIRTRRGTAGVKVKMGNNEVITQMLSGNNLETILIFTNKGRMYSLPAIDLAVNSKTNIHRIFDFEQDEYVTAITTFSRKDSVKYFIFVTKQGMVKKTAVGEYEHKKGKFIKAINLKEGDEVVAVHFVKNEKIGILTFNGNFVILDADSLSPIGRATMGVKGIKLAEDDYVIDSKVITGEYLVTVSENGMIKKTETASFSVCNRGIKGKKISGIKEHDRIVKFLTLTENSDIMIISNKGVVKISTSELRTLSREAIGVIAMKLPEKAKVVDMITD